MASYKKNKVKGFQGGGHVPAMQPLQMRNILGPATGASGSVKPGYMNEYVLSDAKRRLSNRVNAHDFVKRFYDFKNQEENWQDYDMKTGRWTPEAFDAHFEGVNPRTVEMYRELINSPNRKLIGEHAYPRSEIDYFNKGGKVQGYQGGGKAGTAFGLHSAGIKTQRDLEDDYEEQQARQSKYDMWGNLLGVGAGLAGSMLLPGLGGLIAPKLGTFLAGSGTSGWMGSALGKALGRGVASAVPKALAKYAVSSSYKPKQFTSKTGFGLDKYGELRDRGSKFRQRGQEAAGVGMLTDIGMAMLPNPLTGKPAGTMGPGPVEWGGYTPTSDALHTAALQRNPEVENILQQSMLKEQPIPAFGKTPQTLGGGSPTFKLGDTPVEAQASIFGKVPSADTMYNQALQNRAAERAAFSAMTPLKGMQQAPLQQQLNPIRQLLESQYQVGAPSIPQNLFPGGGYQIPTVPPPGQMPYYPPANYPW